MNHHTSSRQRKSASSNGNMKRMQNVRNCSTLSSIPASHRFSNLAKHIPKCGLDLTSLSMVLSPQLLQDLATIMVSHAGLLEGLADTHLVGTLVVDTTIQVGVLKVAEVGTAVAHIHKGGEHHMVLVACLVQVLGVEVVVMELVAQTILRMVPMVALQQVGAQT